MAKSAKKPAKATPTPTDDPAKAKTTAKTTADATAKTSAKTSAKPSAKTTATKPKATTKAKATTTTTSTSKAATAGTTSAGTKTGLIFEALPARYGDCLLLTVPGTERSVRLLIDGGPSGVFRTSLKPHLDAIAAGPPLEKPLTIDAVMVSHIDEDHILGILDLFGTLRDADERHAQRPYQPRFLLHNSFDGLVGEGEGGAARTMNGETVLASLDAASSVLLSDASRTARMVLQSYGQGSKLASLAAALKISRNPPDQALIQFIVDRPRVLRLGEATLTVVGPMKDEIDDLQAEWAKWKASQKDKKATASLAAYLDDSVPNLSSIVALMECGGRKLLLTGDARGDRVLEGLKKAGLMPASGPLQLDVAKLPHHGSARNLDVSFFQQIRADHYVASADGTYGNPDRETLEMIEKARPDGGFTVHLTYSAEACDKTHEEWQQGRKGGPFNPKTDAIADIVARWKAGGKIRVEEGPVRLEL